MNQHGFVKKGLLGICFFIGLLAMSSAQYSNEIYQRVNVIHPADSQKLYLNIDNASFINNNEFFGNFAKGYTLIGFHLTPELVYFPSSRVKVQAGIYLLKYYGLEIFDKAIPTFSFQYSITPSLSMIFGSIYGTVNHNLIEPIFEFERFLIKNHESGLQFLLNNRFIRSDLWLNWEKFILEGDPFQEEFVFGSSSTLFLTNPDSHLQIQLPLQTIVSHKGGQINIGGENVQTIVNSAGGFSIKNIFAYPGFKSIELNSFILSYHDISSTKELPFEKGWASYSSLIAKWRGLTAGIGYWRGDQYITNRGRTVFQSLSIIDPTYSEEVRRLFTSKFILNKKVGQEVSIGLRFETYYDLLNQNFDYTFGLHVIYRQRFFLRKVP